MANCPKCDYHLKLTDWRPNCPSCGVNLVYYGMEERLLADADKAEAEHSHFQKKIDRAKASFVGSKLAIATSLIGPFLTDSALEAAPVPRPPQPTRATLMVFFSPA